MCDMKYYYPGDQFPAISVTGEYCALDCGHCQGHYLKCMIPAETGEILVETCRTLEDEGVTGCLISGGCDLSGRVPIPLEAVSKVREETNLVLNLHTGLVDKNTAEELERIDPYISFEVPTPFVLKNLYRLNLSQSDYFQSLLLLKELKVTPHVMVGLQKVEEIETLEKLEEMGVSSLVLIVFTPTRGTLLQSRNLDLEAVIETFETARDLFPRLILGCMRPRIKILEEKAPLFDGVVVPTLWAREKVEQSRVPVEIQETCCVIE